MVNPARWTLIVAAVALLGGCDRGTTQGGMDFEQVTQAAARQQDRLSASELADWIIKQQGNYQLIDIRPADDFEKGHIKTAVNLPLNRLMMNETLATLPAERILVVYSNGSENAAKAMVMLRLAGFDSRLLLGGYNHWQQQVLNPDISPQAADGETAEVARQRAISCYFSGRSEAPAAVEVAPVEATMTPAFTPPVTAPADKKPGLIVDEGC